MPVRKALLVITVAFATVFFFTSCRDKEPQIFQEFVYTEAEFPQCHASTIVEYPKGELITAFFGGSHESADDVCIYLCRKKIDDTVWSKPVKVAEDSLHACWNPVLYATEDGRLLLFYKTGPKVKEWKGHVKTSYDGGYTWPEQYDFGDEMFGAIKDKPVRVGDGRIISPSSDERNGWTIHFEISDDNAGTWRKVSPIKQDDSLFVIQPTVLTMKDGTLKALCRSRNGKIAVTESTDNGDSWSEVSLTDFPNNNSGIDAVNMSKGRYALVCNPVGNNPGKNGGPRTPLCVFTSKDAENWKKVATLESDEAKDGYSYPAVIYGSDGALHIVYTWRRLRIRYARIKL